MVLGPQIFGTLCIKGFVSPFGTCRNDLPSGQIPIFLNTIKILGFSTARLVYRSVVRFFQTSTLGKSNLKVGPKALDTPSHRDLLWISTTDGGVSLAFLVDGISFQ